MAITVQMPALGESVTEGTVTRWLKQEGDTVEVDEPLLEVSTDKVDTEIPSPAAAIWGPSARPARAVATAPRPPTRSPSRSPSQNPNRSQNQNPRRRTSPPRLQPVPVAAVTPPRS
jgi:Biotin-requiring enzyme